MGMRKYEQVTIWYMVSTYLYTDEGEFGPSQKSGPPIEEET